MVQNLIWIAYWPQEGTLKQQCEFATSDLLPKEPLENAAEAVL